MKKLVLFDIDGTLLRVNGINRRSLMKAFIKTFGIDGNALHHPMSGKLDSKIIEECMVHGGIKLEEVRQKFDEIKNIYVDTFIEQARPDQVRLMPGIISLLETLSTNEEIILGLLTGNFERSGRHKLSLVNINHFFSFGAFAEDATTRNELPPIAVERAMTLYRKNFIGKDVVIIGDTQHDIKCAETLNSKSIAVATGSYTHNELMSHFPDVAVKDLSNTNDILNHILS